MTFNKSMENKMATSFSCDYCNIGGNFSMIVMIILYSLINFPVHVGDHFTLGNLFVESHLGFIFPGIRSWFSQLYI